MGDGWKPIFIVGLPTKPVRPVAHISRGLHLRDFGKWGVFALRYRTQAHPYRGPFRTEHLPVTAVTDADTETDWRMCLTTK